MGNTQAAERYGFDVTHYVQKEKYRLYYAEYKIKGRREIMEDYTNVLLNFGEKTFKSISPPAVPLEGAPLPQRFNAPAPRPRPRTLRLVTAYPYILRPSYHRQRIRELL